MQKELKNRFRYLLVAVLALVLMLSQLPFAALQQEVRPETSAQEQSAGPQELLTTFEQLLPPFINNEGPGVRQVEPPPGSASRVPSNTHFFRSLHTCQLTHQLLSTTRVSFLRQLSERENEGFYLYELCKLLI